MATSSISNNNSTSQSSAAQLAANNRANAQKIMTSMGAGSGVDVASLAENLMNAEKVPRENAINEKIAKAETRINGYAAISYVVGQVQSALSLLKDQNDYLGANATVSNTGTATAVASSTATEGTHELVVTQLAKPQRDIFTPAFTSATAPVPGWSTDASTGVRNGGGLTLSYTNNGVSGTQTIGANNPTDIVKAINGNSSVTGVKAQLAFTGGAYKMVLTSKTGADNSFQLNDSEGVLVLPDPNADPVAYQTAHQASANAMFNLNGLNFTRSSNTVGDVITGVSLNIKAVGSTTIELNRDNTEIKKRFNDLVTAYNDAQAMIKTVSDPKSTVETYGASLVNESYVRTVKDQLRNMLFENSSAWTTGNPVKSLRDLGISIDVTGTMSLDATVLDNKLTNNFDDVVTSMTGNYNDLGEFSTAPVGIAGTASRRLTSMLKATGDIQKHSNSAQIQIDKYKEDLIKLQTRMDALLIRYQKQFAVMDSMVGQNNSLKSSLKSSFDGMNAANKN
ncbi:MAG: hypothetical protein EBT70_01380 [Betaproteobacteria bacterium]|nr:hypothetical protein [Betaproteobacteria bacterium]